MTETIDLDRNGLSITLERDATVTLRVVFDNESDAPMAFTGRLTGSGAPFAALDPPRVTLGGGRSGALAVTFFAKDAGLFDLGVEVMDADGFVLDPPGRRTAALVVKGTDLPAADPAPAIPAPPAPFVPAPPEAVAPEPPSPPKPRPSRAKPIDTSPSPAIPDVPETRTPAPVAPTPPPPRVVVERPKEEPKPAPPEVVVPRETPPVADPTPAPEPPRSVIDIGDEPRPMVDRAATPPPRAKAYDAQNYARVLRNPKLNDVLELPPGGRALVLLDFENRGEAEATYVLMVKDDLRPTEDFAYARVLLGQINIRAGGTDELAFEIVVPENAPPQTLRVRASHGRREGERDLEISKLTLKVTPRIAVKLSAARPRVVVGPLNRVPDLSLLVGNEGNVETAYRLTVKNPADVPAEAKPGEYPDLESRDAWRFLFDKEAEDLRLDGTVPARLRLLRTGIWWFGWWETARVKAVAVPVTDPRNAGRDGNAIDLVGTRWRFLPLPWPLAVPLLLAFFALFLGGYGVRDVQVTNAIRSKASGILFVLQDDPDKQTLGDEKPPVTMRADLSWEAPFLSFLKVVPNHDGATIKKTGARSATAERTLTEYYDDDLFTVTSVLGLGGASTERVVYLPMRTTGKFRPLPKYAAASGASFGGPANAAYGEGVEPPLYGFTVNASPEKIDGRTFNVTTMRLKVRPADKVYLSPTNIDSGKKIHVWLLEAPQSYALYGIRPKEYNEVQYKSEASPWQLIPKDAKAGQDDLWLLTTDSRMSVLHLVIERAGGAR